MLQRLLGLDVLNAKYDPFAGLERVNPLLKRELGITEIGLSEQTLPMYNFHWLRAATLLHLITIAIICCSNRIQWQTILFVSLPSLVISIGTDIYANVSTVFRWHAASKYAAWDTLRLALRDDGEVIHTFETVSTLRSWGAYQLDMTVRAEPMIVVTWIGAIFFAGGLATLLFDRSIQWLQVVEFVVLGVFLIRMAKLYISDPRWRFRANVMWSLLCAITFHETGIATTVAVAGSLGVRLLHLIYLGILFALAYSVMQDQRIFGVSPDAMLLIRWFAVFAVLSIALLPITRLWYTRLYQWLGRRVLFAISSGAL